MRANCVHRAHFYRKPQFRGKSHRAKHAKIIFRESFFRFPHRNNHLVFDMRLPAKRVNKFVFRRVIRDCVHREIAPLQIVAQMFAPMHRVRTPSVRVFPFYAKRRDFHDFQRLIYRLSRASRGIIYHANSSKFILIECMWKYFLNFIRRCIRCHVPIFRFLHADHIAHASANQIRLKSSFLQGPRYIFNFFRNRE